MQLVEFHTDIAYRARGLIRIGLPGGWRLKPKDAIHLATAIEVQAAEFHTYDDKLERYEPYVSFKIRKPPSAEPTLFSR